MKFIANLTAHPISDGNKRLMAEWVGDSIGDIRESSHYSSQESYEDQVKATIRRVEQMTDRPIAEFYGVVLPRLSEAAFVVGRILPPHIKIAVFDRDNNQKLIFSRFE